MRRSFLDFLKDIQDSMHSPQGFVREVDYAAFEEDKKTNFAVVRTIES